eukprot:m.899986 g.899986  ORF g.899986 m.899986 type:complete len:56 (-) comp60037_c0_seq2:4444-4611(-)
MCALSHGALVRLHSPSIRPLLSHSFTLFRLSFGLSVPSLISAFLCSCIGFDEADF